MEDKDEYIHQDYPHDPKTPWKENFYFNFVDRKNRAWGIHHISLMRHTQQGRFSALYIVDDEILPYSNLMDIKDLQETSDGTLSIRIVEPFKKFKVTFHGPNHQMNLDYNARFPVFHFGGVRPNDGEESPLSVQHYRQSMIARGTLTKDGKERPIESFCDRDHTWGYRNEGKITGWNCCHAYFENKTLIIFRTLFGQTAFGSGYLSTKEGNTRIVRTEVVNTQFVNGVPESSMFTGYDKDGKVLGRLKSEKFSTLYLPMGEEGGGAVVHENFSEFTDLQTGEKGDGVDEYLINPNEEYHENPGGAHCVLSGVDRRTEKNGGNKMEAEGEGVDLTAYLAEKMGAEDLKVLKMSRVEQGMSADTFFVDLAYTKGNEDVREEIVVRREPSGGILETYDLSKEYNLLDALRAADIAVPRVLWYEPSPEVFERPFYAMEKVEGEVGSVDPRRPSKRMFNEEERATLARDFVSNIVKTHNFDWRSSSLVLPDAAGDESEALIRQIERHEEVIARAGYRSHPIVALGINWLKQNAPKIDELCILHGDYRVGNFISKDGRIRAVIDWELSHLGDPHEDLAFILSPAWRSADEGLVSHLMTEAEFLQEYQEMSGRVVDPHKLMYFGAIIVLRGLDVMCSSAKNFVEGRSTDLRDGIHAMTVESLLEVLLLVLSMLTMTQDGGAFTNEYGYTASMNGVWYVLLFARREVAPENLETFKGIIEECEGRTFDQWRTFAGQAPKEPRLYYRNLILSGTMGGFVEPAFSFGITGALLSGKISATAVTDPEKAEKEFKRFTGGIPAHMARKRTPGYVPTFKMGDVWFDVG